MPLDAIEVPETPKPLTPVPLTPVTPDAMSAVPLALPALIPGPLLLFAALVHADAVVAQFTAAATAASTELAAAG